MNAQKDILQPSLNTHCVNYTPYGHNGLTMKDNPLLGFTGHHRQTNTGHYALGNGHRTYSPILMRFISPDHYSPFGTGGINTYVYCSGDPVNYSDPSGQMRRATTSASARLQPYERPRRSGQIPLAADSRQNQIPQTSTRGQNQVSQDLPIAASRSSPQPGTSSSAALDTIPNAEAPLVLTLPWSIERRIESGHHRVNHKDNNGFIQQATFDILSLEKHLSPKDARDRFIGGLSVELSDKVYKKNINKVSSIRRIERWSE